MVMLYGNNRVAGSRLNERLRRGSLLLLSKLGERFVGGLIGGFGLKSWGFRGRWIGTMPMGIVEGLQICPFVSGDQTQIVTRRHPPRTMEDGRLLDVCRPFALWDIGVYVSASTIFRPKSGFRGLRVCQYPLGY